MTTVRYVAAMLLTIAINISAGAYVQAEEAATELDEIVLKDGSRILGTVTGARDGAVDIDTDFAGTLSIELEKIASLQTRNPVVMQLADQTVVEDQTLRIEESLLMLNTETLPSQMYSASDLLVVNPEPWELGLGYKWTGAASIAMSAQRGNTDTDELDYNFESIWRSDDDRYTVRYNGENDTSNGERTVKKWFAQGKYDYFFDGPLYAGLQVSAEHDKFTDLDLRYVIGPYIGRQFYEEPVFTFSGELGASYVNENFFVADDDDYAALTWSLDASSDYLGGDSRLYFQNRGIWNVE
ncbi:MAG: DUF481 domain-containing protein, partial [Pseudomonadota bacterium]